MQLQLKIRTKEPEVSPAMVEQLCRHLKERGWVFARELVRETPFDDRTLRAIASKSDGRIISGQKGYCLLDGETSLEDADRAATWLENQAKEMTVRAFAIRRRAQRILARKKR